MIAKISKNDASKHRRNLRVLCTVLCVGYPQSFEAVSVFCSLKGRKCLFPRVKRTCGTLKAGVMIWG